MDKNFQKQLVEEIAKRLANDGNKAAASCLYSIYAAMAIDYEQVLVGKLCRDLDKALHGGLV